MKKIEIRKGVRQGDTLSPALFTAGLEEIFRRIDVEAGININGERLSNLRFADDIILFAKSEEQLEEILEKLNEERKDGMKINISKTKILCNESGRKRSKLGIIVDDETQREVNE